MMIRYSFSLFRWSKLALHFTVLYCTLPVVTCSVNDMSVDPAELFAIHLYIPLSSMLRLVRVRLVLMWPVLMYVVTPSISFSHTRLVTLGYGFGLHINVTLSETFTSNNVWVGSMMGGSIEEQINNLIQMDYVHVIDNNTI